jgi:hypothetical protein
MPAARSDGGRVPSRGGHPSSARCGCRAEERCRMKRVMMWAMAAWLLAAGGGGEGETMSDGVGGGDSPQGRDCAPATRPAS